MPTGIWNDKNKPRIPWNKGKTLAAEYRKKLSDAKTGKKLSAEHVAKLAKAHTGLKRTAETKAKMSASKIGNKAALGRVKSEAEKMAISERMNGNQYSKGKKLSEKTKAKLSANARGWMSPRSGRSKWYELTKPDGTTFKVQGTYELRYAKHLLKLGIVDFVAQPKPGLKYIDQFGGTRTYNPDFWVPSLNSFVEIKSSYTISVRGAKRKLELVQQAGHPLIILTETEMKEMGIDFSEKHPELT